MNDWTSEWVLAWYYEANNNNVSSYVQIISECLKLLENYYSKNNMDDDLQFIFIGFDNSLANQIAMAGQNNFSKQTFHVVYH